MDRSNPVSTVDSGLLFSCDRALSKIENGLNFLAAGTIFIVMIATTAQIGARLAGFPVPGFLEFSEQAIAVFAFLGAAYAQRLGAHIRMELFVGMLKGRLRHLLELLTTCIAFCVVAVLIPYSIVFFLNAYTIGDSTLDYNFPTWPSKLLVPIALSIWLARLTLEIFGFLRLIKTPDAEPLAIPVIKSTAEVAHEEVSETFGRDHRTEDQNRTEDKTGGAR